MTWEMAYWLRYQGAAECETKTMHTGGYLCLALAIGQRSSLISLDSLDIVVV